MSVMVKVGNRKAFLRSGSWTSADLALENKLNQLTTDWIKTTGGPKFTDADQERTVAEEMARRVGGKVQLHMRSTTGRSADVFLQQRQMELEFTAFLPGNSRRAPSR